MSNTNVKIGVLALQGAFIEHISALRSVSKKLSKSSALVVTPVEVRCVQDMQGVDGLIIPGGESTSMSLIGSKDNLLEEITGWVRKGNPVWGTCAGCIMLAKDVQGQKLGGQGLIGSMDISVHRNYFGRQRSSFEMDLEVTFPNIDSNIDNNSDNNINGHDVNDNGKGDKFPGIFIRAPAILSMLNNETNPVSIMGEMVVPDNIVQLNNNSLNISGNITPPDMMNNNTNNNNNLEKVIVAVRQGVMLATVFHPELTDDTRFHEYFVQIVRKHMEGGGDSAKKGGVDQ